MTYSPCILIHNPLAFKLAKNSQMFIGNIKHDVIITKINRAASWAGRGLPLRQGPRRPRQTIYNCSLSIRDNHRFSMATTTKTTTTTIIIITVIIIIMIMIKIIVPPVCTL